MDKYVLNLSDYNIGNTIIEYMIFLISIVMSLLLIIIVRRYNRKEASFKNLKNKCIYIKNYIHKIQNKTKKEDIVLMVSRLNKLTHLICEATWISSRIADEKKDVILDDITSSLDMLATNIYQYSLDGVFNKNDYLNKLNYVLTTMDDIYSRCERYMKEVKA